MRETELFNGNSRRDFLKKAFFLSSANFLMTKRLLSRIESKPEDRQHVSFLYQFRTMSVDHFGDLQEDIDKLKRQGKLSHHKVYRSYIDNLRFKIPDKFPEARSIIIMAIFTPAAFVDFEMEGKVREILLSPQYYDDGISQEDLENVVRKEIIREPGHKIERTTSLHLKLLAVRSGLGRYGRNNLCFVEGLGTFISLCAFFTDYRFAKDSWHDVALLEACRECQICYGICPTNAIRRENFVIDVGRCITLYNEIDGEFPNWILPSMHDALMGCMKCQLRCPVNEGYIHRSIRLETVREEETKRILQGDADEDLLKILGRKLKSFPPATKKELFPILTRNLGVLIKKV